MFHKAFTNPSKSTWIVQFATLLWFLATFWLLEIYGVDLWQALIDGLVYAFFFFAGVNLVEKTFDFYTPSGLNTSMLLVFPLGLSLLFVFLHGRVLNWIYSEDLDYLQFLRQNWELRWLVLGGAEVLVALLAMVVSKLDEQKELKSREVLMNELSREAELTSIRQQLQPHFLFNSLNSISALVVSQPQKAREMVLQLSDFLRGTIRKDHKVWVSLEEELGYLKMYLDIERVRFGHRLQVTLESGADVEEMKLPQLLIQPLLENAIKHGLYGMTGTVYIHVKASKEQNYLIIRIENPFDEESAPPKGAGFGLSSVSRRLELLFGRTDLLASESKGGRFTVTLKIPQLK